MAYDETYSFATLAANENDFIWDGPDVDVLSVENTDGSWCWTNDGSTSSGTGPPTGTPCVYTETSSPVAVNDVFIMTLAVANEVDAAAYLLYVTFNTCTYGNTSAHLYFEAFDGTDWNAIDDWAGNSTTTFTSRGPYDFTSYDNDNFSIRFRTVVAGTTYTNDMAVDEIRIYGDDAGPAITNAGDEDFTVYETNIVVTGTAFGTDTGSADLELGDSATYGSANLESQSIDSWADTSIQFDLTIGSLDQEQLWLYVTDSSAVVSDAYEVNVNLEPTITIVGDDSLISNEANVVMTGATFLNAQGTGKVELSDNATYATGTKVTQSIDSWANGSIQFDVTIGSLTDTTLWVWVTNDLGFRNATGHSISMSYPSGPVITDAGDELFETTETNIVLTGTDFGSPQGSGKVELVNNSVYASGTKVTQSIDTWADTSIQMDLVIGSLTEIDLWLFVTDDSAVTGPGYAVQILRTPTITNIEDETFNATETGIVLDGTYLQDTQGSGKLEISDNVVYATGTKVSQTINTWADDEINFDLELGSIGQETMWMWVTNDIGELSLGTQVTITGLPISTGFWKTSSIQGSITNSGFNTTIFLISDE